MTRAEFLRKISLFIMEMGLKGYEFICFTFYRSPEDQLKEFEAGRSHVKFGKHQQWLAMDLCLWDDLDGDGNIDRDELRWKNDPRYTEMGKEWEKMGGTWGGRWKGLNDVYHFEG